MPTCSPANSQQSLESQRAGVTGNGEGMVQKPPFFSEFYFGLRVEMHQSVKATQKRGRRLS